MTPAGWLAAREGDCPARMESSGVSAEGRRGVQLEVLNDWMEAQGLPRGVLAYDFADTATGQQKSVFDLAWPRGIQAELSQPVVVLLNEGSQTIAIASQAGFRCFTAVEEFRDTCERGIEQRRLVCEFSRPPEARRKIGSSLCSATNLATATSVTGMTVAATATQEHLLSAWLTKYDYTSRQIKRGSPQLRTHRTITADTLRKQRAVYSLLRYRCP